MVKTSIFFFTFLNYVVLISSLDLDFLFENIKDYKPLNKELYSSRDEFIDKAQHPEKGILVVGEAISRNQGWTEGALESVKAVLTKKWIETIC